MEEKQRWKGIKSIEKVVTTIDRDVEITKETRYYISSLNQRVNQFEKAVRKNWGVESMRWHLDVTFGEDANHTLDKTAAQNLNIIRKMAILMLKELPFGPQYKRTSLKSRRFIISLNFPFYLGRLYEMFFVH